MVKQKISRKKFLSSAIAGFTGIKLMAKDFSIGQVDNFTKRTVGSTGIMVSPICFGAPRTNDESLIRYVLD